MSFFSQDEQLDPPPAPPEPPPQRSAPAECSVESLWEGKQLGEGSYGSVFACRPRRMGETARRTGDANYVIKLVPLYGKTSGAGRLTVTSREELLNAELKKEIQAHAALRHSSFIPALL